MRKMNYICILSLFMISCGGAPKASKLSASGDAPIIECEDNNCFQAKKQKVLTVISHRQILPNFQRCLGLTNAQVSANTKTVYKDSLSTFSQEGQASDVSAPMMMAIMNFSSEICMDLIKVEKTKSSGRQFFPGYSIDGAATSETYNLNKTLQALSKSCWAREITPSEINLISKDIVNQKNTQAALYACTAVLSSAQAVKF
jgi:hypothetical protein